MYETLPVRIAIAVAALLVVLAVLYGVFRLLKWVKQNIARAWRAVKRWMVRKGWLEPPADDGDQGARVLGPVGRDWKRRVVEQRSLRGASMSRQAKYERENRKTLVYDPKTMRYTPAVPKGVVPRPTTPDSQWVRGEGGRTVTPDARGGKLGLQFSSEYTETAASPKSAKVVPLVAVSPQVESDEADDVALVGSRV